MTTTDVSNAHERLRQAFVEGYQTLNKRLARRLGSEDLAREAFHDVYLKLDSVAPAAHIGNPTAYLFRMACNAAEDRRRQDGRRLVASEIDALFATIDPTPDPETTVAARRELQSLTAALNELSPRRRRILVESRLNGTPHRDLADQHDVSVRTIEMELKQALEHCAQRLDRPSIIRFGPRRFRTSNKMTKTSESS